LEQQEDTLVMLENERPMEKHEGIAIRLVDVLPIVAEE